MDHEQTILIGVHLEMKQRHMCSDKQEEVQMVVYRPPSENIFSVSVRYTVVHSMNRRSVLCQIDDPMSLTDCVISQSGRKLRKPVTSNFYSSHSQIVYLQQRWLSVNFKWSNWTCQRHQEVECSGTTTLASVLEVSGVLRSNKTNGNMTGSDRKCFRRIAWWHGWGLCRSGLRKNHSCFSCQRVRGGVGGRE